MSEGSKLRPMLRGLLVPTLAATIAGCTVGPDRPAIDLTAQVGSAWSTADPDAARDRAEWRWWQDFGDAEMTALIEASLEGNLGVAQAAERLAAARARRGIDRARGLPTLDASASYEYAESGNESASRTGPPPGTEQDVTSVGLLASWELDLWGRVRRLVEAADAEIAFAAEDVAAARVALAAEVAIEVIAIRSLDERRRIVERTLASDEATLAITASRARAGVATDLDRLRAERTLASRRAELPLLAADRRAAECRIAILLGRPAATLSVAQADLPTPPPIPPLGVPADLLERRPDIRRAEQAFAAAHARIGAAVAERYPKVTLSGTFAMSASDPGDLFDAQARTLGLGPTITLPLFTGGRIESTIDAREAEARAAHRALEETVVRAVAEVETACARQARAREQVIDLERALALAADAESLAQSLYRSGRSDFLNVIEAQFERFAIEERLAQARTSLLDESVRLVTALGGGWLGHGGAMLSQRSQP